MTSTSTEHNPYEALARERKAAALAAALRALDVDAATAQHFDQPGRQHTANFAGVNTPGPQTWDRVVELLALDERIAQQTAAIS